MVEVNGLEGYYSYVADFIGRFSQEERISRIDQMNYRVAIREIYLHLAGQAFKRGDLAKYDDYNSRAEKSNQHLISLGLFGPKARARRVRGGLEDFKETKRQLGLKYTGVREFPGISS